MISRAVVSTTADRLSTIAVQPRHDSFCTTTDSGHCTPCGAIPAREGNNSPS